MSYFTDISTTLVTTEVSFAAASTNARSYLLCKAGEVAGWGYDHTDDGGNVVINIYNRTSGTDVLIATVYNMAGQDIFCGLFSSGAIPTKLVTDPTVIFYKVDYV
jgi:hypothetical protein